MEYECDGCGRTFTMANTKFCPYCGQHFHWLKPGSDWAKDMEAQKEKDDRADDPPTPSS